MTDQPPPHIEGVLYLRDDAPALDSASDLLCRVDGILRLARHVYPDTARLMPGQSTRAQLTFAQPTALRRAFRAGMDLDVHRDTEKIGRLRVTEVLSIQLAGTPPSNRVPSRMSDVITIAVVDLIVAVPTLHLAIEAHTPCESNFEGGCGMGRGLFALGSLVPATVAVMLGVLLSKKLATQPAILRNMPAVSLAGSLLWLTPLGYLLFTVHALFFG